MAQTTVWYLREFFSETEQRDVSPHGSPIWKRYQGLNKEDDRIRRETTRFSVKETTHPVFGWISNEGFDGNQLYHWSVKGSPETNPDNPEENVRYKTCVEITKAGARETLETLCDLESILIERGFSVNQD